MSYSIPIKDKKVFIQWFLKNYNPKKRESVWILNYLLNHEEILNHVHFVRDIKKCPRAIVISTKCSNKIAFQFFKRHIATSNPDKAYHDIRLNPNEPIYIQVNFFKSYQSSSYALVLEDNPFTSKEHFITIEDKEFAKELLQKTLYTSKLKEIKKKIDHALDVKDRTKFIKLTAELKELKKKGENQPEVISQ